MITRDGFMRDFVRVKKPSAAKVEFKRFARAAKERLFEVVIFAFLLLAISADFLG